MPSSHDDQGRAEEWVQRTVVGFSPSALQAARGRLGWSRDDLAAASGLGATTIGTWERGEVQPTVPSLAAVARALKLRIADLLSTQARSESLTQFRVAFGLTIQQVADQAGFSTATISRAESGSGRLTDRVAAALAGVYDVSEADIEDAWQAAHDDRIARLRGTR